MSDNEKMKVAPEGDGKAEDALVNLKVEGDGVAKAQ